MANDLGEALLKRGMVDAKAGGPVAKLQQLLRDFGALQHGEAPLAGTFDAATATGVRRLQWYAVNVDAALRPDGTRQARTLSTLAVDGVVGDDTRDFLLALRDAGVRPTGALVKARFGDWQRIRRNGGYQAVLGDSQAAVFDASFADALAGMDAAAATLDLHVFVNQIFRIAGVAVSGAVVTPATNSAHLIGRAVDLQLGLKPLHPQLSSDIAKAAPGTPFARFREHAKKALHCRYGGDFGTPDPPHFDRQIADMQEWSCRFHWNQRQYQQALVQPGAIAPWEAPA